MEFQEIHYEDNPHRDYVLSGLARACPQCHVINHYGVSGKNPVTVTCPCGFSFTVQKFKKGQRPKCKHIEAV